MGAWQYISSLAHNDQIGIDLSNMKYVARKSSASPATGFKKVHDKTQVSIVERAFNE
jgi:2-oxoglutarate dehydrogenase E1 component